MAFRSPELVDEPTDITAREGRMQGDTISGGNPPCGFLCRSQGNGIAENTHTKKAMLINSMASNSGGTDGTRTRDPLRDRQVF